MHPVRVAGIVTLLVAIAVPADAILCRKKNGAVFVRDACKRRETVLDPATIGAVGAPGNAGANGTTQPRLRAVDATGRTLPGTVTTDGELLVPSGAGVTGLLLRTGGAIDDAAFYEAPACAGPALLKYVSSNLYNGSLLIGTTLHAAGSEPAAPRSVQSQRDVRPEPTCTSDPSATYDPATGTCCFTFSPFMLTTIAVTASTFDFTAPFRLELVE